MKKKVLLLLALILLTYNSINAQKSTSPVIYSVGVPSSCINGRIYVNVTTGFTYTYKTGVGCFIAPSGITNGAGNNVIPKSNGTNLVASLISDNGTDVTQSSGIFGAPVINATTGFRLNGAATSGNVLRGNGTNFVSAQLSLSDLSIPTPSWTSVTFQNSWNNIGGANATVQYTKISGVVYLKGMASGGTATAGTIVFNLPAGYRPAAYRNFAVISNNAFGYISIAPNGDVAIQVGVSGSLAFDNISFPAEQ